jgi:uncharacterized membrane protein
MNIRKLSYTALSAALIFAVTAFIRVPVPLVAGGAYINLGDAVIIFCSALLGGPLGAAAAAIGSGFADLAASAPLYAPATFIIKGIMGFLAGAIAHKRGVKHTILAAALCGAVMVVGYGLYEIAVFDAGYAVASLPFNLIQWGGSVVATLALSPAIEKLRAQLKAI